MFDSWCSFQGKDLNCCFLLFLFCLTCLFTHISYVIVLQVFGTYPEPHLSKWHKILCPGVSRACVYFMTLHDGCKKLSHDFTWLAQVPFELLRSLRVRAERRTDGPVRLSPPFLTDSRFKGMSYSSGLSELPPWYPPTARHLRRTRLERNRPLSDSDIWAAYLPALPPFACRSITDHSCLKVYNKDPAQAFSHGPRPANGDARVSAPHTCKRSH